MHRLTTRLTRVLVAGAFYTRRGGPVVELLQHREILQERMHQLHSSWQHRFRRTPKSSRLLGLEREPPKGQLSLSRPLKTSVLATYK